MPPWTSMLLSLQRRNLRSAPSHISEIQRNFLCTNFKVWNQLVLNWGMNDYTRKCIIVLSLYSDCTSDISYYIFVQASRAGDGFSFNFIWMTTWWVHLCSSFESQSSHPKKGRNWLKNTHLAHYARGRTSMFKNCNLYYLIKMVF